jgi:CRP-like cAMP-binding protein
MAEIFFQKLDLMDKLSDEQKSRISTLKIKKGDTVYNQGESPKGLYYIDKGHIGLISIASNGNESLLRVFGPEQFFGHRSLISEEIYHASAIALVNTELVFISKENFDLILEETPCVLHVVAQVLAKELRRAENKFKGVTTAKVTQRIIQSLAFLKTRYPDYKWTRREIGEYCGAKTETVSRVLSTLEKDGLITKDGRDINIDDIDKLYEYAEGCCE